MTVFRFVLLTLVSYRFTRLITTDDWPPTKRFRELVSSRFGEESAWHVLVTCPWCVGAYVTAAVFAINHYLTIPEVILAAIAATALVGYLGTWDDRG